MQNSQALQSEAVSSSQNGCSSLTERELRRVAEFIGKEVGIQLSASKHTLVEGRLRKRLRKLGFNGFKAYLDHVLNTLEGKNERLHLIDAITTNKTDFFREPEHFRYLVEKALPEIEKKRQLDGRRELSFWSAGCSSGEEAYTLSMVLNEAAERHRGLKFNVLATDISKSCLTTARNAIYPERRIDPVPMPLRKKYFLRSSDSTEELVQMGPELRNPIQFGSLNLIANSFGLSQKMDVIFCRNVMIYFNNSIREQLVRRFEQQLIPGGYLFVGHSESLNGLENGLEQVAPMVYRKPK